MGFTDLFIQITKWTLVSQDDGTEIQGQFPPTNLRQNVSGNWGMQNTVGKEMPVMQFLNGAEETVNCDVKVWAKHQGLLGTGVGADDIEETVELIKSLPRSDPDLGRPHVWLFTVGTQFSVQVVVKSVGQIRYDRMRPKDGTLRGVLFSLDMSRYEPYDPTVLTETPNESLVTPFRAGETFEHIAARTVGDPRLGEALRRRNPDMRIPQAGQLIHVPPPNVLRKELFPMKPQSLFFRDGDAQRDLLNATLKLRGAPANSFVVLEDF
jgi:hypothetical protein